MTQSKSVDHNANPIAAPKRRFPEFRNGPGWELRVLGSLASINSEKAGDAECVPMSITSGVGLVSQMEKFGRVIAGDSYRNYLLLRKNDFAYNKSATKQYPEGFIALYTGDAHAAVPNSIFTSFRLNDSALPEYLNFLFLRNLHGQWLRKFIEVGARAHGSLSVSDKDLLALPVPMPSGTSSRAEQQKIVECLSTLDELIDAESQKLDALKTYKSGLMRQLFPHAGETSPRLRFLEFQNALGWEERSLESVARYENGKAYEPHIVEDGKYVVVNSRFISTDGAVRKYTDEPLCIAKNGDILMVLSDLPKGRALAKCFQVDSDNRYAVNQRVCRLKPYKIDSAFFYFLLDRHPQLLAYDDGQNQTHLKKDAVLKCPLLVPRDLEEQHRIASCLSSLTKIIIIQTYKLESLRAHRVGLAQQLFPDFGVST